MGFKASQFTKGNSAYIKGDDVKERPIAATISEVEAAETPDGKPCLQLVFDGGKKLTLNKTNTRILAGMIGDDTDGWIGKRLAVKWDPTVMFGTKMVGGLRVEVLTAKAAPAPAADDDLAF